MGASHTLAGIVGGVGCFALAVTMPTFVDTLGAEASNPGTVGLWVYTPYINAGDRVLGKVLLKGGDRVRIGKLEASIDDQVVPVERIDEKEIRPSKRYASYLILVSATLAESFGSLELELDDKTTHVEPGMPARAISQALREPN